MSQWLTDSEWFAPRDDNLNLYWVYIHIACNDHGGERSCRWVSQWCTYWLNHRRFQRHVSICVSGRFCLWLTAAGHENLVFPPTRPKSNSFWTKSFCRLERGCPISAEICSDSSISICRPTSDGFQRLWSILGPQNKSNKLQCSNYMFFNYEYIVLDVKQSWYSVKTKSLSSLSSLLSLYI